MALFRRAVASAFFQSNLQIDRIGFRNVSFSAHQALLAEQRTGYEAGATFRTSERGLAESQESSSQTEEVDADTFAEEELAHRLEAEDYAGELDAEDFVGELGAEEGFPESEGELEAEKFSEYLTETAIEVEEQGGESGGAFTPKQMKNIDELEEMALEKLKEDGLTASEGMAPSFEIPQKRQAPLPEDFVPPPEAAALSTPPQNSTPPPKIPPPKPQEAPVIFPRFIPPSDKSRPAKPTLSLDEALRFIKSNAKAKFDETIEAVIKLGVNPKRGDQMVRGAASLPYGSGKPVRIAVFASGQAAEEAKAAGADVVGDLDLVEEIKKGGGKLNFDRCIATPAMMPMLGQVARILGPRGLMPNPKVGTITNDVAEAVRATKRGRVSFRADKTGTVHVGLGKVSFGDKELKENLSAFAAALLEVKPAGAKGVAGRYAGYLLNLHMSSSMGPGVKVDIKPVGAMAEGLRAQQTS